MCKKIDLLRFDNDHLVVGGKAFRDITARLGEARLVESIEDLLAAAFNLDQPGLFEDAQVMGYCWLGDVSGLDDLVHAQLHTAAQRHDFLAGFIGQRFGKFDGIYCFRFDHTPIISINFDMSRAESCWL